MHRISELGAVVVVAAVLFLGLQYAASVEPQPNPENSFSATVLEAPAYAGPGDDNLAPLTVATVNGVAGLSGWYVSSLEIILSASDNGTGVSQTLYSFDDYLWTDYTGPVNVSSEGRTAVYYYSMDAAGNSEPVKSEVIMIDMTPPLTEASLEGNIGLNGWYTSSVTVTLSAVDVVSGIAYTEFSLDGADWAIYNGPFAISQEGPHQLVFRSADVAANIGSNHTLDMKIDRYAPTTVAVLDGTLGSLGWYRSGVSVTLMASDSASQVTDTQYSVDGSAWSSYSIPFTISGTGVHTVQFLCTDLAGNTGAGTVEVNIDMIPPMTAASIEGNLLRSGWYVTKVTITLYAMDEASGPAYSEYGIEGGPWTTYDGPFTIVGDGYHEVRFRSVDLAGNVENINYVTIGIDRDAPITVPVLSGTLGLNGWYVSQVTLTLLAIDNGSGVADIEYDMDNIGWSTYNGPITFYNDGVYTLYFYSADFAGNTEDMKKITIFIDKTAPDTTVDLAGKAGLGGWYVSNVIATLTASDGGSSVGGVRYSFDGRTWLNYTEPIVVSAEGISEILFFSFDNAGNIETTKYTIFSIDEVSPTTTADIQGKLGFSGWYVAHVTVSLAAIDTVSGTAYSEYSFDGNTWLMYAEPLIIRTEGTTSLYYRSVDNAGNTEGAILVSIPIDNSPPITVAVLQGLLGTGGWYISDVNVTLGATDSGSGTAATYYSFDNSTWNTYVTMFNPTSEGSFRLYYFSIDSAGNIERTLTTDINVDMTPPTTELNTESYYSSGLITLTATDSISGVAHTYYRIDGANWIEYFAPFQFGATGGQNAIEYYSIDNAGNEEWPKSTTFELTEVEVTSFVSYCPYSPCKYTPLPSFDVFFTYHRRVGYTLMTGSWLLWYNIEVKNVLSEAIPALGIVPSLPSDFAMRGLTIWLIVPSGERVLLYIYLNRTCGDGVVLHPNSFDGVAVSFDGHAITLTNLPSGARAFVSVAMEYELRGSTWASPGDFQIESYTFSATVQASGTYYSWYALPVVSHIVKQHSRC